MLDLVKVFDEPLDNSPDLGRRADPCAAGFDLAVQRERRELAHGFLIALVVFGGGSLSPVAHPFVECAEIFFERTARDLAREGGTLITEHMESHQYFPVAGMPRIPPRLPIGF